MSSPKFFLSLSKDRGSIIKRLVKDEIPASFDKLRIIAGMTTKDLEIHSVIFSEEAHSDIGIYL